MRTRTGFTPEALANLRYRYVETNEPITRIARDFRITDKTVRRIAQRENWPMRSSKPRELPLHIRLRMEADNAACAEIQNAGENQLPDLADRLERAVEKELAAVERTLSDEPDRTARTLASLTATLSKIRSLRASDAPAMEQVPADDDMPEDIDEFRRELARRIDAFVDSRTEEATSASGEGDRIAEKPSGNGSDR
jgi:hypothetical protein